MSAKLIFSFDSEDYETPAADDAELWWAEAMTRHGLRASVCVVGELARALDERGRRDVLDAWRRHEIAYHSDMHSAHPTHAEYLEVMDWDAGCRRVSAEEGRGLRDVRRLTGRQPIAHCKPGASWGPQVAATLERLGVPVFCDAPYEWAPGLPAWYCGSLLLKYQHHFDGYFADPTDRVARMQRDLVAKLEATPSDGYLVMYTHPCRLVTASFPQNFTAGRNPPREAWRPAPLRTAAETAALQRDFDAFLRWVGEELRPEMGSYQGLFQQRASRLITRVEPEAAARLAERVPARPAPIRWEGGWLSAAEQWEVVVGLVGWESVPRRLSSPFGPVEAAASLEQPLRAPFAMLQDACRQAAESAATQGRLPASVAMNGAVVGPNALLQAARAAALHREETGAWPAECAVLPAEETPALAEREDIARMRYQRTWSIFPPEFEGRELLRQARRQLWTMKPA